MTPEQARIARKNLDRRLAPLKDDALAVPAGGWLKAVREALGLTVRQLAARLGASPSRVPAIEKAELSGATSIKTLRGAAAAMDCVFVYAIVPRTSLETTVEDQAGRKADADLAHLHHTMQLEQQALTASDLADARARMVQLLLAGSPRRLWDAP
jgi:predicted DNA-binding mobile mystery protein A